MKNIILNSGVIKCFLYAILITVFFASCDYGVIKQDDLTERLEKAYFEGQRDYANGDIRTAFTKDSCWVWTKSPWNSGRQPIFDPSVIHSRKGN